ncbi:MAG: hypothetical protein D6780_07845 [Candidatus Dadabacteria bacterium]|nr:MAG: hypothetical protein D6780_07845 [Candidatus Dadabacteria bacterium]
MKKLKKIISYCFIQVVAVACFTTAVYANHCGQGPTLPGYNVLELKSISCSAGNEHTLALSQKYMSERVVGFQVFISYNRFEAEVLDHSFTSFYGLPIYFGIYPDPDSSTNWIEIAAGRNPTYQDPTAEAALLAIIL